MSKINWDRSSMILSRRETLSISDEQEFIEKDTAAEFLKGAEKQYRVENSRQAFKKTMQRLKNLGKYNLNSVAKCRIYTREEIESNRTPNRGFTAKVLYQMGVPWPPPSGWLDALLCGISPRMLVKPGKSNGKSRRSAKTSTRINA